MDEKERIKKIIYASGLYNNTELDMDELEEEAVWLAHAIYEENTKHAFDVEKLKDWLDWQKDYNGLISLDDLRKKIKEIEE